MPESSQPAKGDSVTELTLRIRELEEQLAAARQALREAHPEAVRELAESEERFALAVRGTNDGVWDWNIRTDEVYYAPRFKQLLGYEDHEMENLFSEFEVRLHDADHEHVMAALKDHLENRAPYDVEYRLRCKDGEFRWFRARGSALRDADGRPYRMAGSITDITEQKASIQALALSEERFSLAVRGTNDGIWDWDIRRDQVFFSPHWKKMLGYEEDELENRFATFEALLHPDDHDRLMACLNDYLEGRSERYAVEFRARHKDGSWRWILARGRAMRDSAGKPYRMAGSHTDVTERKRDEEELRQARLDAEAANSAKSVFLANMSHEIRTPMNGIIGMGELLLESDLTDVQREYLEMLKHSADSLLELLNDLLDFSKIEAGKMELDSHEFDLNAIVTEIVKAMGVRAFQKRLVLLHHISPEVPSRLIGDDGRLRQILVNLIGNAIKFTHKGGVTIEAAVESETADLIVLHFKINDTGIGISGDLHERIFEAFTQAESSITRRYGGTGLGLAICRDLVELMHGRIWVESQPSVGSTFHFTAAFGRTSGISIKPLSPRSEPVAVAHSSLKVLVVEDGHVNQLVSSRMLEKRGHRVTLASSGEEALELFKREAFDVILMDVQMPGMNGLQATAAIREIEQAQGGHVPVVAMTANALSGDRELCLASGMDDYLSKPLRSADLFQTIEALAGHSTVPSVEMPAAEACLPPLPPPAQPLPFDMERFRESAGDEKLLQKLIAIFPEDTNKYLKRAEKGMAAGKEQMVYEAAHSLKGMLGVYAAPRAVRLASELSEYSHAGDLKGARFMLDQLKRECARVGEALAASRKSAR